MDGSLRLIKAVSQFHTVCSYTAFTAQRWLYAHTADVLKHKYLFHTFFPTYQMPIFFPLAAFGCGLITSIHIKLLIVLMTMHCRI